MCCTGINYLNLNVKSWKHSKQLGGIISHCFDASLEEGSCPKCFEDSVTDLHEMRLAKNKRDAQELAELAELAVAKLSPISAELKRLIADPGHIDQVLADGARRADEISGPIVDEVYELVGLLRTR